ncbi:uncharacterized protein Dwil_GK13360 [Drosophila willistoni]|uniref:Uncharacterized protein n=2 Tax=Drosophila willistoni TaxID=7260 RepID=B4NKB4_DROWI|nr:uncharacterized protein Dwil_GK13360 [Drosophila willistoni]
MLVHFTVPVLFGLGICLVSGQAQEQQEAEALPLSQDMNQDEARAHLSNSVPYFRASIPMRVYECLRDTSMLRCTKLYVLQKMEERKHMPHTANLTKDFLDQFFGEETQLGSLVSDKYQKMSEKELNLRLVQNFQRFFKHRDLKLHILPGMLLKVIPSKENKLKFTLKKNIKSRMGRARRRESDDLQLSLINLPPMGGVGGSSGSVETYEPEAEGDSKQQGLAGGSGVGDGGVAGGSGGLLGKRKHKKNSYKVTMLQMAVPILVLPVILLGSLLPFILPALKMATILSLLMNNGAFMAALLYAARTQANNQDEQHISYS